MAPFAEVQVSLPEREMLYFSIQNARGGREKEPRLRGGLRTDGFMVGSCMLGSWSDHSRIARALEMTLHLFSPNFSHILDGYFAWQVPYLVSLDNDTCCSAHCK